MELVNEYRYGGFWVRFVAIIIDGFILYFINLTLTLLLTGDLFYSYKLDPNDAFSAEVMGLNLLGLIAGVIYYAGMNSSSKQATFGKIVFDLKVVDTDGNRISFLKGVGRYFSKILSAITLLIGYIMAAFDSRKQALHDKLAGTMVVYTN